MRWTPDADERALLIQYLRWPEVAERLAKGFRTIVFAVGATEQHGPHLPELVDELIGTEYAIGVAKRLGDALVAPTIRPGMSAQHGDFPGTIAVRHETLKLLIEDYLHSLHRQGFRRFVVISSHFGNRPSVQVICEGLQREFGRDAIVVPIYQPSLYLPKEERFADLAEGFHANNFETSLMLHLAPALVDMAAAAPDGVYPEVVDRMIARAQEPVKSFAPSGVLGHPERANAETGAAAFEAVVDNMAHEVEQVSAFLRAQRPG